MMTIALPDPAVVLMIGASGSGKSTVAARLAAGNPDVRVVSYDACREELSGDMADQTATPAAVALAHRRIADLCATGVSPIVDGTHTHADHRAAVRDLADQYRLPLVAVVVSSPLAVCLARQRSRSLPRTPRRPGSPWNRAVPELVVRDQHAAIVAALPTLHTEGYAALHIIPGL